MLTRRAAKCILRFLPNEVLAEIAVVCPTADQAALCRTSRLFHEIVTRVMYRSVSLKSSSAIRTCCRTLINNLQISLLVKSLKTDDLILGWGEYHSADGGLASSLSNALDGLKNLESLMLGGPDGAPPYLGVIADKTFPHLTRLHIRITQSQSSLYPALPRFLQSHPKLTVLKLFNLCKDFPVESFADVRLPALRYFKSRTYAFPLLIGAHNRLESAEVVWKQVDGDIGPPIAALCTGSGASLKKLVCFRFRDTGNTDLIQHIAEHLPTLSILKISSKPTCPMHDETMLQKIAAALAHFTKLRMFAYTYAEFKRANRAIDAATVTSWGRVCPTLQRCVLSKCICRCNPH
ncbi:hypothetical protein C8R43DRAFT_986623 [Mycena crocata]|nr:hypothetical protein C8R43DRAFT_986623 [Mycena crocata]